MFSSTFVPLNLIQYINSLLSPGISRSALPPGSLTAFPHHCFRRRRRREPTRRAGRFRFAGRQRADPQYANRQSTSVADIHHTMLRLLHRFRPGAPLSQYFGQQSIARINAIIAIAITPPRLRRRRRRQHRPQLTPGAGQPLRIATVTPRFAYTQSASAAFTPRHRQFQPLCRQC